MEAITDYKIEIVKKAAQYFKPDFFTSFDDVATERGLFMSPGVYRELIKPHHKRLNDAVKAYGMAVSYTHLKIKIFKQQSGNITGTDTITG